MICAKSLLKILNLLSRGDTKCLVYWEALKILMLT